MLESAPFYTSTAVFHASTGACHFPVFVGFCRMIARTHKHYWAADFLACFSMALFFTNMYASALKIMIYPTTLNRSGA